MAVAPLTGVLERDRELALLDRLVADTRAGRGHVAVIEGPAGQGKTTILRELRRRAAAPARRRAGRSGPRSRRP